MTFINFPLEGHWQRGSMKSHAEECQAPVCDALGQLEDEDNELGVGMQAVHDG